MARSVYLTAIEPGSGKSVVALGMMESLSRLGYFRPIVPSDTAPDNDLFAVSPAMRRAEGLDVSSFAAQDACAAEQPPPAKRSPCRAGSPGAAPANPVEGMEVAALGVHRLHREWVRREAEVESRVLIDDFLRERASGLTSIVRPSRPWRAGRGRRGSGRAR